MRPLQQLYRHSLALLTDLYQLTMAYGYWQSGMSGHETVFHLYYRKNPFQGGYVVTAGLSDVVAALAEFHFTREDREYLATLTGNDGKPLFDAGFLEELGRLEFACDVDAMPEGTVAFPHEPLLRVRGPIIQCQLFETILLNIVNFQTLIATKAARICQAAKGNPVVEFGLRRAQGIDGGLSASRSAYIGGCVGTSNVLAGKLYGIPVKGTHAHSWVMAFDTELEAFDTYAAAMPNNCIFLVDTYDTLEGVRNAVRVGQRLREQGHKMVGIRLDSGDLAWLSVEARKILDAGGFPEATIVASNDLDEYLIASLKEQGAEITLWGIGTKLVTAYDQPALGGVYKLSAIREPGGAWEPRIKLSEQAIKVSTPGTLQVRRFRDDHECKADVIYDIDLGLGDPVHMIDPMDPTRQRKFDGVLHAEDLLVPIFRRGRQVYDLPPVSAIRQRAQDQLPWFHPGVRRHVHPHQYPVGLEAGLQELKHRLILAARGMSENLSS